MDTVIISSPEENKAWQDMNNEMLDYLFWGTGPLKEHTVGPERYWAKIMVDGKVMSAFVDKHSWKAYRAKEYERTDEEITNFQFIRWMRMHEI